ncbi:MAG: FKBP-type peptidyl-prolyl cis-trans isomerase [Caulobacteraceae bacterium]
MRTVLTATLAALALAACAKAPTPTPDAAAQGKAFLASNAHVARVVTTPSGLEYRVLRSGPTSGLEPKPADEVKVDYEGKLLDGEVFDSSYERGAPAILTVRDLVPGWQEALQHMRPGDEWLLYVPPKLGYGDKGVGPIPPNSVLVFKLDLIGVLPAQSSVGNG